MREVGSRKSEVGSTNIDEIFTSMNLSKAEAINYKALCFC